MINLYNAILSIFFTDSILYWKSQELNCWKWSPMLQWTQYYSGIFNFTKSLIASVSGLRIRLQAFYQLLSEENLFYFVSVIVFISNNSLLNSIVKHHCWFWNCIHTATSFQNKNRATKKVSTYIKVTWFIISENSLPSCFT